VLLQPDIDELVSTHNAYRSRHLGFTPVAWQQSIADQVSLWLTAKNCPVDGSSRSSTQYAALATEGENLYANVALVGGNAGAIGAWYNEIPFYNFAAPPGITAYKAQHFMQLVWVSSTNIGCGTCSNGATNVLVCRYSSRVSGLPQLNINPVGSVGCPTTNPCLNGGSCVDGTNSSYYSCVCAGGYSGVACASPPITLDTQIVANYRSRVPAISLSWNAKIVPLVATWCSVGDVPDYSNVIRNMGAASLPTSEGIAVASASFAAKFSPPTNYQIGCSMCGGGLRCIWGSLPPPGSTTTGLKSNNSVGSFVGFIRRSHGAAAGVIGLVFGVVFAVVAIMRRRTETPQELLLSDVTNV